MHKSLINNSRRCQFNIENKKEIYICSKHGNGVKIFTESYPKDSNDLIMVEFSQINEDGFYNVEDRVMVNTDSKCGSELVKFNYCGQCGSLLGKPKDPEKIFEDFKKMICGVEK
jgi:hypothetical protein